MVISTANSVLIHVRQLQLDPGSIITLLMQDSAHRMPEPVSSRFAMIANAFEHLIDARFAHRFCNVITAGENQIITPGNRLDLAVLQEFVLTKALNVAAAFSFCSPVFPDSPLEVELPPFRLTQFNSADSG